MVMVTCSKGAAERTPVHPALSRVPFDLRLGTEESWVFGFFFFFNLLFCFVFKVISVLDEKNKSLEVDPNSALVFFTVGLLRQDPITLLRLSWNPLCSPALKSNPPASAS